MNSNDKNNGTKVPTPKETPGAGVLTPSNNHDKTELFNGTKVPTPKETPGGGVLTPFSNKTKLLNGTKVPTPEETSTSTPGAGVLTPSNNHDKTKHSAPEKSERNFLPHIDLIGHYQFVTFRTHDSIDAYVKKVRDEEIGNSQKEYKIDQYMDRSSKGCYLHGQVLEFLKNHLVAKDKDLYELTAFTIMPNHIHILFKQKIELSKTIKRIKGATAFEINKILQKKGVFWEENYFDKAIRDEKHFDIVYDYIRNNALKAGLNDARDRFYSIYE